jgi:hypothetical protein
VAGARVMETFLNSFMVAPSVKFASFLVWEMNPSPMHNIAHIAPVSF